MKLEKTLNPFPGNPVLIRRRKIVWKSVTPYIYGGEQKHVFSSYIGISERGKKFKGVVTMHSIDGATFFVVIDVRSKRTSVGLSGCRWICMGNAIFGS